MSDPGPRNGLRFQVLGPLRAWRDGTELDLGPAKQRVVLAALLLHANKPVNLGQLADAVWDAAPARAVNLLQRHVSGLRRVLEPHRVPREPSRVLAWTGTGYLLAVPDGRLDLLTCEHQAERARAARAAGDLPGAARALRCAVRMWRGRLCEGLTGPLLEAERDRLAERRLDLLEERIEADLALGADPDLVGELRRLVGAHPLRERLHGLLMHALYRSGRQAEALRTYQEARRLLDEELGVEPGPELRRVHERILAADAALGPPAAPLGTTAAAAVRPARLLPPDVTGFVGRREQLAQLDRLLEEGEAPSAPAICVIVGTAGVGKTALAVHWAHRAGEAFPDGQLYADLRGYGPQRPVTPGEALAGLLTALGVRRPDVPARLEERAARYRGELAGRRMLVVLDNAATAAQVRPLLPGGPDCRVIVTSRDSLAGLVVLHGAHRLTVDRLPADEAAALLRDLIGERARAEPKAVGRLARQCARLPLALRVAAERATAHPYHGLPVLVAELADLRRRLDLLDAGGDPGAAVRTVFSWSYRHLPPDTARAFRLLALHPGPDLEPQVAAALTGTAPETARRLLEALARAHLLQPTATGRYGMHDLLRAYAAELAAAHDAPAASPGTPATACDR
ncbi:AfsR/SARP family transcriptional regulator [Streptomyces minutiscleroticus]|uniref:OmpR/PhoB-type domain-containing protein n=1 Tax=Streptomyces minutiscleroticus TaxID=68238 RepID=A0A918U9A0_9ACTN|nr:AfsR/SARP family transcriptional regulator [Streptomyces minutiscleroticus]GGY11243.1 hypothetical protein GCM10010358_74610 [Streptomyces minutiscleroticus]